MDFMAVYGEAGMIGVVGVMFVYLVMSLSKKSEAQQDALEKLKIKLSDESLVKPYSLSKEVTLECDASEYSIGAVLSQEGNPVMYMSRTLNRNERNYAVIEREALAIVWAVMRAEKFLLGRKFTLRSDHRAL